MRFRRVHMRIQDVAGSAMNGAQAVFQHANRGRRAETAPRLEFKLHQRFQSESLQRGLVRGPLRAMGCDTMADRRRINGMNDPGRNCRGEIRRALPARLRAALRLSLRHMPPIRDRQGTAALQADRTDDRDAVSAPG